eukprot:4971625-Amphidinium_carterae.1
MRMLPERRKKSLIHTEAPRHTTHTQHLLRSPWPCSTLSKTRLKSNASSVAASADNKLVGASPCCVHS